MSSAFASAMPRASTPKNALAVAPKQGYAVVHGKTYPLERLPPRGAKPTAPVKPMVQRATYEKMKEEAAAKIAAMQKRLREGIGSFSFQKHGVWVIGGAAVGAVARNFIKSWLAKNPMESIPESVRPFAPSIVTGGMAFLAWKSKKPEHKHFAAGLAAEIAVDMAIQFIIPRMSGGAPAAKDGAVAGVGAAPQHPSVGDVGEVGDVGAYGRSPLAAEAPSVGALDEHLAAMRAAMVRNAQRADDDLDGADDDLDGVYEPSVGEDDGLEGVESDEDLDGDDED